MNQFRKNIARLYVVKISKWFNLVMPVVVLFYQDNDMGMHEIFILKSIYSLAIVALELPSGWMADVWGRKKTLLLGSCFGKRRFFHVQLLLRILGFCGGRNSFGCRPFLCFGSRFCHVVRKSESRKKSDLYVKHEGRITSAGNFAEAIAGIAAGFLAAISLRTPFYFQFVVATLAIPAAFSLTEPGIKAATHVHSLKQMALNLKNTLLKQADLACGHSSFCSYRYSYPHFCLARSTFF
jgi:MFS family permease